MIFKDLSNDIKQLEVFATQIGHKNIFYTQEWFEVLEATHNQKPFVYGVADDDNQVLGVICGVIQTNFFWPLSILTSRAIVQGGPIVKNNNVDVLNFILQKFTHELGYKCVYIQIRNNTDMSWAKTSFIGNHYIYEPHLDIFIDLEQGKEAIKKNISKNKRRNVTKSINKGAIIKEITKFDEFLKLLPLVYNTYKRVGLPIADQSLFDNAYRKLQDKGFIKCFAVFLDEVSIGIRIELVYNGLIYDWYAGSNDEYRNHYPNDVLPFSILNWGVDNGCTVFDFGGAGKPDKPYGVRDHKMKFGGDLVEFGRYEKVQNRLLFQIGKFGLWILKKIK